MRLLAVGLRNFWHDSAARTVLGAAAVLVAVGSVFYRRVEDLTWLDSIYFCVISLTTVGYGDFSPVTRAGKIFTMFYVVIGIGVFVALVTIIAHHLLEARKGRADT